MNSENKFDCNSKVFANPNIFLIRVRLIYKTSVPEAGIDSQSIKRFNKSLTRFFLIFSAHNFERKSPRLVIQKSTAPSRDQFA